MKNLCKAKGVTRGWSIHWWLCLLLVLGFTAGLAVNAGAEYAPQPSPSTKADLTLTQGRCRTLVIRVLNMTPYNIEADPLPTVSGYTDTNRGTHKSFMFAPLGIPNVMPGLKGNWIYDTQDNSGLYVFTPTTDNASAHPYNFVVSWDDQGGYVTDSKIAWTIRDVIAATGATKADVRFRMWFTREKPANPLLGELFKLIAPIIKTAVHLFEHPDLPFLWVEAFTATAELAAAGFESANSQGAAGDKMYFSAYTVPEGSKSNPDCTGCDPSTITPSTSDEGTDAVDVQWGSDTGSHSSEVVVTTHLLRGSDKGVDSSGFTGEAPIASVTLWTPEQYVHAQTVTAVASSEHPLGQQLRAALGPRDLSRYAQFAFIYKKLNPSQRRTLQGAVEAFRLGNPLTQQEIVLIEKMIGALEKGQTKLSPANR